MDTKKSYNHFKSFPFFWDTLYYPSYSAVSFQPVMAHHYAISPLRCHIPPRYGPSLPHSAPLLPHPAPLWSIVTPFRPLINPFRPVMAHRYSIPPPYYPIPLRYGPSLRYSAPRLPHSAPLSPPLQNTRVQINPPLNAIPATGYEESVDRAQIRIFVPRLDRYRVFF